MALIITGHQRSGTTLLMRLCNSHPEVKVTGEFGNFIKLGERFPDYARFILNRWWRKRNAPFLLEKNSQVRGVNMMRNFAFVLRYLRSLQRQGRAHVGVSEIETALKALFPHARISGDKYPDYGFKLNTLIPAGDLRCLFIYRDPRDVALSSIKRAGSNWRRWWPEEMQNPQTIARRWVRLMTLVALHPDRIKSVCYERLVANPQPVMSQIGDWLDIDARGFQHDFVRIDRVGKYEKGLTKAQIAEILSIAGPTMEQAGYSL